MTIIEQLEKTRAENENLRARIASAEQIRQKLASLPPPSQRAWIPEPASAAKGKASLPPSQRAWIPAPASLDTFLLTTRHAALPNKDAQWEFSSKLPRELVNEIAALWTLETAQEKLAEAEKKLALFSDAALFKRYEIAAADNQALILFNKTLTEQERAKIDGYNEYSAHVEKFKSKLADAKAKVFYAQAARNAKICEPCKKDGKFTWYGLAYLEKKLSEISPYWIPDGYKLALLNESDKTKFKLVRAS